MPEKDFHVSLLDWSSVPQLRDPFLVIGFDGWSNAGSVSTDTIQHLVETLKPSVIAGVNEEPFINYTLDRPVGQIEDGIIHDLEGMSKEVFAWESQGGDHDLVLFSGKEPHFGWPAYSRTILAIVRCLSVKRLYTVGGVQDTVSHSASPLVTVVGSSPIIITETCALAKGMRPADYYGPVSIHSWLIKVCMDEGVEAASLWGHVPAYLQRSPKLVAKIVGILNEAAGMQCPVDSLNQKSIELDRKINEALAKDPNLKRFVETIEQKETPDASDADDKVIRLNDFLRRDSRKDPES